MLYPSSNCLPPDPPRWWNLNIAVTILIQHNTFGEVQYDQSFPISECWWSTSGTEHLWIRRVMDDVPACPALSRALIVCRLSDGAYRAERRQLLISVGVLPSVILIWAPHYSRLYTVFLADPIKVSSAWAKTRLKERSKVDAGNTVVSAEIWASWDWILWQESPFRITDVLSAGLFSMIRYNLLIYMLALDWRRATDARWWYI